jgi:hypothetical protein
MGVCALFQMVSALESADLSLDSQCRCLKGWVVVAVVVVVVVAAAVAAAAAVVVWVVEVVVTGAEFAVVLVAADLKLQLIDLMPI